MIHRKSKKLIEDILHFSQIVGDGITTFDLALRHFCQNGADEEFVLLVDVVKKIEEDGDNRGYQIKSMLYEHFLLPESSEDIAHLLNMYDTVLDNALHTLKFVQTRRLKPVQSVSDSIAELLSATVQCYEQTAESISAIVGPHARDRIRHAIEEVGNYETVCDTVQERIIVALYDSDLSEVERYLHCDFIERVGTISDACEDTAAIVGIMNMKRLF